MDEPTTSSGEPKATSFRWMERVVNPDGEYLSLRHDDWPEGPVALVGPPVDNVFPVAFPGVAAGAPADVISKVRDELDYYLVELGESDAWGYAHYHCTTVSNAYPPVHWSAHNPDDQGEH